MGLPALRVGQCGRKGVWRPQNGAETAHRRRGLATIVELAEPCEPGGTIARYGPRHRSVSVGACSITMISVIDDVRRKLRELATPEATAAFRKFVPTAREVHGVRVPLINELARE